VPAELVGIAREHRLVVTIEDGVRNGGVGDAVSKVLRDHEVDVPLRDLGVDARWIPHGTRNEILAELGLTATEIASRVTGWHAALAAKSS
jgi:1-deoxy-D-xylulose-5-phosphate synthase